MSIEPGQSLLHYRLVDKLGQGGMGVVWRAVDTTLDREVAIKVLPDAFATDPERLARFEREAKVLASLNHPNIASIHSLHQAQGLRFLAMELVPGEDLAERLGRGPLPPDRALAIAAGIAEALAAAHERGVIHRDLKPANVKLASDGAVKVLDFGLAKAFEPGAASGAKDVAMSPTLTSAGSVAGMILGTAGYMSPEQARGKPLDKRTDIWSFGCVLFEMLTGRRAFGGETVPDIIARILEREPEWELLPAATPPTLRRALRRCLQRDPRRRYHDMADVRLELEEIGTEPVPHTGSATSASRRSAWPRLLPWALAAALGGALLASWSTREAPTAPTLRFTIPVPDGHDLSGFTLSPDGRYLAFTAAPNAGREELWVRALDSTEARALPGTEGATFPFWSPDGRSIAFFSANKLRRIDLASDTTQVLADASNGRGGAWSPDDVILFTPEGKSVLYKLPASGGTPTPVTELHGGDETSHRFPHFLPDGRGFLYATLGTDNRSGGIWAASLDSDREVQLVPVPSEAYFAAGRVLYVRDQTLFAQPFDPRRRTFTGEPFALAKNISATAPVTARAAFSVSGNGMLAYRTTLAAESELVRYDRSGRRMEAVGPPGVYQRPVLSPDGRRIVFARSDPPGSGIEQIWILDPARGTTTRLLQQAINNDARPAWAPDGGSLAITLGDVIVRQPLGSTAEPEILMNVAAATGGDESPYIGSLDWSAEGDVLMFENWASSTDWDLWTLRLGKDDTPRPTVRLPRTQFRGRLSPDGRFVAYESNESGTTEIYVQQLETGGGRWLVSAGGGLRPQWRADGRELFYRLPGGGLMVAGIRTDGGFETTLPDKLFDAAAGVGTEFMVAPDGQHFIMNVPTEAAKDPGITVVVNWPA